MKIVGILDLDIHQEYTPKVKELRSHRYKFFNARWIELVLIDMNSFDIDTWKFLRYKSQFWDFEIIEEPIAPWLIRVRTSKEHMWNMALLERNFKLFPSPKTISITIDKWNSYKYFSEYHPKTEILEKFCDNWISALDKKYILKPRFWLWWEWVKKVLWKDILKLPLENMIWKYIVQELCDFSWGIPWITRWNHDLRLVFIWWKLSYVKLRTNSNDFRVNISKWWSSSLLQKEDVPQSLLDIAMKCLYKLWWWIASAVWFDFGYDSKRLKWILIEVNYSSWFTYQELVSDPRSLEANYEDHCRVFTKI